MNVKLRPKILSDMKPGSRVVSHSFDMDDWQPDDTQEVDSSTIYYWVVPAKVEGKWDATFGDQKGTLDLKQQYQNVSGTAKIGDKEVELKDAKLKGDTLTFCVRTGDGNRMRPLEFTSPPGSQIVLLTMERAK